MDGCNGRCGEEEEEEGPFESLCHELRRVEESMCRYLRVRSHPHRTAMASDPPDFYY
jgi:hypothetical protein